MDLSIHRITSNNSGMEEGRSETVIPHEEWISSFNETIKEFGRLSDIEIPCILCAEAGANIETIVCGSCRNICFVCKRSTSDQEEDEMPRSNLQCSRCKVGFYCSVECQKNDWAQHKEFCVISDVIKRNYIYKVTVARAVPEDEDEEEIIEDVSP